MTVLRETFELFGEGRVEGRRAAGAKWPATMAPRRAS